MPFTCTVCVPVGCWVIGAAELGLDGYREEIESSIYILNIQDQIISFLSRHTINPKRSFNGVVPAKNQWYFCLLLTTPTHSRYLSQLLTQLDSTTLNLRDSYRNQQEESTSAMRLSPTTLLITALGWITAVTAHNIQLKAHSRECFHESLHKDDRMSVSFQVGDREFGGSGNLDIDFWVRTGTPPFLFARSRSRQKHANDCFSFLFSSSLPCSGAPALSP
jgi:hypothetical protein